MYILLAGIYDLTDRKSLKQSLAHNATPIKSKTTGVYVAHKIKLLTILFFTKLICVCIREYHRFIITLLLGSKAEF